MSEGAARDRIRDFLSGHFHEREFGDEDDIFALGYVNSLFAMQLVAFVEREFGIVVESEDLEFDNFRSVDSLTRLVEAKTGVGSG